MINTSPLPLGCAKQQCQTSIRAMQPATGNGNGKRAGDARNSRLQGERFAGGSFSRPLKCHVPKEILRGTIRAELVLATWPLPGGCSWGRGGGPGSQGSQLLHSKRAQGGGGSEPQQPLSSQASGRHAPTSIPANTTQGVLNLSQLKQHQPTSVRVSEETRFL